MFMDIKNFVRTWQNRGYEKGESQTFWLNFLRDVLNVQNPENFIKFEVPVKLQHTNFIDAFFPDTKVIVEQKSISENFSPLKPFEQAQKYVAGLPVSMHPKFIIVCNFQDFFIYDMEKLSDPQKISLNELPTKFNTFNFLIDKEKNKIRLELEISLKAGEIVKKIYNALLKKYIDPNNEKSLQSLNKLCVRLVFCLFAESAGIFKNKIFSDYLANSRNIRRDLQDLFQILNTPQNLRDPYLDDTLKNFPFVNGGLFQEVIEIPNFTQEIIKIFDEAANFNWSGISPTIFGAVFESTLNPVTRRAGGMHYTSVDNIHRVIDNLFLNDLIHEFDKIKSFSRNKRKNLLDFQDKISKLIFFDPACGSGNFLTESFISLRRLENKILKELLGENILLGELDNPVKISINQFFGIEINDFAVSVAQTAMWIAELQMLQETQEIIHKNLDFLPLKSYANIFEGNALRMDWQNICPNPNFIFGNPPFVGKTFQNSQQKADMKFIFADTKNFSTLDYVACWYKKTCEFINHKKVECAFVSTNSITQGEQVTILWKKLSANMHITINFAYRTFTWESESADQAAVHCVIIGFSNFAKDKKLIFDGKKVFEVEHINFYLQAAEDIFIAKVSKPLQKNIPPMIFGSKPTDDGNLILDEQEKDFLIEKYPNAEKFVKILIGGKNFLHNEKRYCLWLVDANPSEIKKIPPIYERIKKVREFRLNSKKVATQKSAETSYLFQEIRQPKTNFIAVPRISSEKRKYIPMDFLSPDIIVTTSIQIIPEGNLFLFGILESSLHMVWVKAFCGRLKSDFNYSGTIVYNNFPFPEVTAEICEKIKKSAEKILEVRAKYLVKSEKLIVNSENPLTTIDYSLFTKCSLADLYDENLMPKDLRDAHRKNDEEVLKTYGLKKNASEEEILSELTTLYKNLTGE